MTKKERFCKIGWQDNFRRRFRKRVDGVGVQGRVRREDVFGQRPTARGQSGERNKLDRLMSTNEITYFREDRYHLVNA